MTTTICSLFCFVIKASQRALYPPINAYITGQMSKSVISTSECLLHNSNTINIYFDQLLELSGYTLYNYCGKQTSQMPAHKVLHQCAF